MISGPVSLIGGNCSTDRPAVGALHTRADSNLIQLAEYRPWKLPSEVDGSPTGPRGAPGKKDHALNSSLVRDLGSAALFASVPTIAVFIVYLGHALYRALNF